MRFHWFSCVAFHVSSLSPIFTTSAVPSSLSFSVPIFLSPTKMRPSGLLSCRALQRKWDQNLRRFEPSKSNFWIPKKKCVLPSTLDGSYHDATCIFHTLGAIRDSLGVFHVGGWVQDEWHRVQIRTSSDILKAQTPFSPIYHQILPTTMQQILTTVEISKTFWMILESWHQALYTKAPCCSALLSYKRHLQLRQQQVVPTHRYANQTDLAPAKIMKIKEVRGEFQHRIAKI